MSAIRIRTRIDSDTLTLPELRPFIGRTVEIVIEDAPAEVPAEEFWAYAANLPSTETEFVAQQEQFRRWRTDSRYQTHWPMIDRLLDRDFETTRKWAEINNALREMTDYDFDAYKAQRQFDAEHTANPPR
jgi:hypothetical protein